MRGSRRGSPTPRRRTLSQVRVGAPGPPVQPRVQGVVREQLPQGVGHRVVVVRVDRQRPAVGGDLPHAAEVRRDGRGAGRQGLRDRQPEALVEGREHGEPGQPVGGPQLAVGEPALGVDRAAAALQLGQPAENASLFQELPPTKLRLNARPSRHSSSAACSTARWFLRGSWLPTTSTSGRSSDEEPRRAPRRGPRSVGSCALDGQRQRGDGRPGQADRGQHRPPAASTPWPRPARSSRSGRSTGRRPGCRANTPAKPSRGRLGRVSGTSRSR